jgi:hypothetical protein
VRSDEAHYSAAEREVDTSRGSFRGVPFSLVRRDDAVSDLDNSIPVGRPFEANASDDRITRLIYDGKPVNPGISRRRLAESPEPVGRNLIRRKELTKAVGGWQAEAFSELLIPFDQRQQIAG